MSKSCQETTPAETPMADVVRGARRGPCGNPQCFDCETPSGNWQNIPDLFQPDSFQPPRPVRLGSVCLCHWPKCRRYFGLLGAAKPPGRKRAGVGDPPAIDRDPPKMPASYIVKEILDVWGMR